MDQKIEASGNSTIENVIQVAGNFYFESQRNDLLKSREREIIISRVRMSWIDGVLTPSVKDVGVINLQLEVHHKAFERGELQSIKYVCPPTTTISHATSIDPRFVDKGETIVILGPPGSGKTTVLLRFAAELLDRAQGDAAFPIATVFRLASWRPHQTLEEWLTSELITKYDIPPNMALACIVGNQILRCWMVWTKCLWLIANCAPMLSTHFELNMAFYPC